MSSNRGGDLTPDKNKSTIERVHVIILVHGWLGCPQDLAYIHYAMEREAAAIFIGESNDDANQYVNDGQRKIEDVNDKQQQSNEPFVIHTCTANEGRTNDGIQKGADRITEEIQDVMDKVMAEYHNDVTTLKEITFSMLGFSLGGLYARVAMPKIIPPVYQSTVDKNDTNATSNRPLPKFTPKLFCTMATPHLGCLGHMYIPVPNFVMSIAPTGRDLIRRTPVLQQTVTDPKFTEPLLRFEKRIAYANTFGMDMMVPTTTAVFLSNSDCSAEHHVVHHDHHGDHPHIALVVETKAHHELFLQNGHGSDPSSLSNNNRGDDDASDNMADRLDAMGWTKVFVDYTDSYHPSPDSACKTCYKCKELISEFACRKPWRFYLPNGHDLMPVNSKSAFLSFANRKGRPLVDQMAKDFVYDVVYGNPSAK
eukprot:CAMPEP_0183707228 /NCGR_PEP_ID=MMETSP0737-20130205/3848_1 /TAXON_ID=385413 /ORGANISM="Thalassiosira miniscula, Strain CCMP1093" /LENGTH=422 /DNA_ID=CAMNT_0025934831 /DNA_START=426 /DNA_END=1694 /DNA_ORIENTATION=+